jgi:hypothetical protein
MYSGSNQRYQHIICVRGIWSAALSNDYPDINILWWGKKSGAFSGQGLSSLPSMNLLSYYNNYNMRILYLAKCKIDGTRPCGGLGFAIELEEIL